MKRIVWTLVACGLLGGCGASSSDDKAAEAPAKQEASTSTTEPTTTTTTKPPTTTTTIPRATLEAEIKAEIDKTCTQAAEYGQDKEVSYYRRWASVISNTSMNQQVEECVRVTKERLAGEEAARLEQEIANAGPANVDEIIKNPEGVKGQVFTLVSEITQFDAATGQCSFRGYWDNESHEYNFDYAGDNAFFEAGDTISDCPVLNGIDQEDIVRLTVRGGGSYSYDTQAGGNTTAPLFEVLRAEVIEKR